MPSPPVVRRSQAQPASQANPLLYVAIGVGGVCALLLVGVVVLLASGSGSKEQAPASDGEEVARAEPAPAPPAPKVWPKQAAFDAAQNLGPAGPGEKYEVVRAFPGTATTAEPVANLPSVSLSPEEAIKRVKDATVLIKVKLARGQGSGTGFVIQASGDTALIATNRHVVSHNEDDDDDEPSGAAGGPAPQLSVVFRSGEGAGVEQTVPATVLAVDSEPGPSRDLAVISVRGVRNPPKPIDPASMVPPAEGMSLKIYGFPFGERINVESRGNPVLTLSKGMVSALQKDNHGRLSVVQLDGSVQPGNSGGPVVDERGRLIGVTVAKFRSADGMGLAVPATHLRELLDGRIGGLELAAQAVHPGAADLQVRIKMADPMGRVRDVAMRYAPLAGDPNALQPDANGSFPTLPDGRLVSLALDPATRTASGKFQAPLGGPAGRRIAMQVSYRDGRGRMVTTPPFAYDIPEKPGPIAMRGNVAKLVDRIRKTSIGRLGPLVDPDKDCTEKRTEKGITISVPGKLHTLSPQIHDRKNRPLNNAPRALADVDGDFLAHVSVAGDMRPGTEAVSAPGGQKIPLVVQGGGLLLWQDQNNFLRLERSCGTEAGGFTLQNRLILEIYQNGNGAGRAYVDIDEGAPLHVMIVRQNGHLRCLFSNDPAHGWKVFRELAVEFPAKIGIGVSAFNISKKPYSAQFEDFVLVLDKDKIESELKPH